MHRLLLALLLLLLSTAGVLASSDPTHEHFHEHAFRRIATFPVFLNTDVNTQTIAEIVAASEDGKLLVYTDSAGQNLGFVDITTPHNSLPAMTAWTPPAAKLSS